MLFFYTARNNQGQLIRGTVESISAQAARQALASLDLVAEELHEATLQEKKLIAEGEENVQSSYQTPNIVLEEEVPESSDSDESLLHFPPDTNEENAIEEMKSPPIKKKEKKQRTKKKVYYPFTETLQLYAGWLLAWYCIVYALGAYQYIRDVSFHIPFVEALLPPFSPVVLTFTLAAFLFLMLCAVLRAIGGGKPKAFVLSLVGIAAFSLYRLNV